MRKISAKEVGNRLARMIAYARVDAGKSQECVAKKMGVSKTTIQNWESGSTVPTLNRCIEFFNAIDKPPLPYFLQMLYGEFGTSEKDLSDQKVEDALITRIKACTPTEKRKLLFILYGEHGSSSHGIIEMVTAHLHIPLKDRLSIAQSILLNYEIAKVHGKIVKPNNIQPDIEYLQKSYEKAKESVLDFKNSYTNVGESDEC